MKYYNYICGDVTVMELAGNSLRIDQENKTFITVSSWNREHIGKFLFVTSDWKSKYLKEVEDESI